MSQFRYKAFISYSWADAKWGNWLHHAIETYRTPTALVGKEVSAGPVPARLHPLFKDREEEAAGASIGTAVETALANSEFLIVICSPNSAKSEWVNREIAWFKTHRDPRKVLALIVDGEPGSDEAECFPKALTHEVDGNLSVTDRFADMPLAADARDTGDGKRRAKLKLAAAMLGVGLDELVNREERRRLVRTRIIAGASLALALVMSGLTLVAVQARNEAERQRAEADGLIEFMLTDLREKLEPVGRLDALDVVGTRALDYYARQKLASLDADALGRRARALLLVGEISNLRGDSEEALKAFTQAAATTKEQLARDPDNEQRIFDHAQSVFWVGAIAYGRGETENAETQFREYKRLADRLNELNPDKPEWRMESSYAETNLGVMYDELGRDAEAERAFTSALVQIDAVAASEPFSADRQVEIGATVNWLGKVKGELGKYEEALKLFRREIAIYRDLLLRDPSNALAKNRLSVALQFLGENQLFAGNLAGAIESTGQSLELNGELRLLEPDNTEWQQTEVGGRFNQAQNLILTGRPAEARQMLDQADRLLAAMIATDASNTVWTNNFRARSMQAHMFLAMAGGNLRSSSRSLPSTLMWIDARGSALEPLQRTRLYRLAGDLKRELGQVKEARALWELALAQVPDSIVADPEKFFLWRRLGNKQKAAEYAARLDRRGYRHPAYLSER
ncbi:toll/interleukin-1 receptor domain-containing protein [Erythrobacter mangrovi]|uniref:TIR domain-containing protein n=1 Tax=Erythrobacter mangrovi TaxID=2739433 RepID=A0A7D3XSL9_9SPHN|nr:toll/interleukin-1 receptor domain-containing protein [Erythrobacter mangrovi]QKG71891.1 TIR domain-containing protein [Erythrobacter mangrovi]